MPALMLPMTQEQAPRDHRVPLVPIHTLVAPRSIWKNANFVGICPQVGTMHMDRRNRRRPEGTYFGNLL
jgi:hypothetical protein